MSTLTSEETGKDTLRLKTGTFVLYETFETILVYCHVPWIGTNVANPIDKDNIIGDAEQVQLTNMRASAVEL